MEFARCNLIQSWSRSLILGKRIKMLAIVKRRCSRVSSFFHLSAIHSCAALRSISRKYGLHVCIARTLFLLRHFSFIRLVYYEKLVWVFLSALLRQEEKTRKSRLHASARNACRDFVKLWSIVTLWRDIIELLIKSVIIAAKFYGSVEGKGSFMANSNAALLI